MIRPLGFMDVARLSASFTMLYARDLADSRDPTHHDVRHFRLWEDAVEVPRDKPWKAAKGFLTRLRGETAPLFGGVPLAFDNVAVRSIAPGGRIDWQRYAARIAEVHVCLNPSPGAFLYSGGAGLCPPVGQLLLVEHRALHSTINLGPCPYVELVAEFILPNQGDQDDDPEELARAELEA